MEFDEEKYDFNEDEVTNDFEDENDGDDDEGDEQDVTELTPRPVTFPYIEVRLPLRFPRRRLLPTVSPPITPPTATE